jgi:hypothetical protein
MTTDLSPLRLLLVTLAGWVNRHQQQVIEYLVEENRVLKEQLKGQRVRLTDDQRRRLAAKGQPLGRRILRQVATIVKERCPQNPRLSTRPKLHGRARSQRRSQ